MGLQRFSFFVTLALVARSLAAIGPAASLVVANAPVAPDGFLRDAIVVNGVFPSPLITGNKVGDVFLAVLLLR